MNAGCQMLPAHRGRVVVTVVVGAAFPVRLSAPASRYRPRLTHATRRRHACLDRHELHKEVCHG
jgi:hypothetical protein